MNVNIVLFALLMTVNVFVLFVCAYESRHKDDMIRKRSRAIGIFITLVMNTIYSSYALQKNLKFSPGYVVFIAELSQILIFSLSWRLYKLVVRKKMPENRSGATFTEQSETAL